MPNDCPNPPQPWDADESEARRQQVRQELEIRFRHCLRTGQICPLFHLMMRYRMGERP